MNQVSQLLITFIYYCYDSYIEYIIIMNKLVLLFILTAVAYSSLSSYSIPCKFCHDVVHQFQKSVPPKPATVLLNYISYEYCAKKHMQNPNVCKGAVTQMTDSIINSVWRHYTDPHGVCHKVGLCPKEYKIRNLTQDMDKILKGKVQKEW